MVTVKASRLIFPAAACAVWASLSSVGAAQAASALGESLSEGFALDVFEPSPAGDRFFAVADASSSTDGKVRLLLLGDWAYGPSLSREDESTGETRDLVSSFVSIHGGIAYPITGWLHAHANVPFVVLQNGDDNPPEDAQLGDVRVGVRANVLDSDSRAVAFGPAVDVWLPTGSEENLTGDGAIRVNPRAHLSGRVGAFAYAANAGYLFRKDAEAQSLEVGDAVTFAAAAGVVLFDDHLQLGPEIWGNRQLSQEVPGTETTPVSALVGARLRLGDVVVGVGAGPGLSDAPGVAPRIVASVALAPETRFEVRMSEPTDEADPDRDGVYGDDDSCPDEPGISTPEPATNGCPEKTAEPERDVDSDGDEIVDSKDACPELWGDPSEDPKKNGCPAEVSDRDGDGIADSDDACPEEAGVKSADPGSQGCPELSADVDGDGIIDSADACPNEAGQPSDDPKANGCTPQAPVEPQRATPVAHGGRDATVTFAGFHAFPDGRSRIFVKITRDVTVDVKKQGTQVDYVLQGAKIHDPNNRNPLITKHFESSVMAARLVPNGEDVVLRVELRKAVKTSHRISRHPDGSVTLHIDFTSGGKRSGDPDA